MSIHFTEFLAVACDVLRGVCADRGLHPEGAGRIEQIGNREFQFELVAAAHFSSLPIRRFILGMSAEVAHALETAVDAEAPAVAGESDFQRFCTAYGQALNGALTELRSETRFLEHDARRFRVRAAGSRNFHYALPAGGGAVELLVDLEPRRQVTREFRPERGLLPDAAVDTDVGSELTSSDVVRAIFAYLAGREADVRIKITVAPERFEFLPATVLDTGCDTDRCVLTAAGLDGPLGEKLVGESINLLFSLQGKLLEGTCRVETVATGIVGEGLELPLLQLRLPERLAYGQRRGADRIVPRERLRGTVQRLDPDAGPVGSPLEIRILDLSVTGMRAALANTALLSGLKWGTRVVCELELPDTDGSVRVDAVVRRLMLSPDQQRRRGALLGVEFTAPDDGIDLAAVRRYLRDYQGVEMSDSVAVEPVG